MRKYLLLLLLSIFIITAAFVPIPTAAARDSTANWLAFLYGADDYWCRDMANNDYSGTLSYEQTRGQVPALRVELRDSDPTVHSGKRSEIGEIEPEAVGGEYVYRFSVLLPGDGEEEYVVDPRGSEIIAQWHNVPDPGEEWTCPPVALHTGSFFSQPDHYTLEVNYDPSPQSTDDTLIRARYDLGVFTEDVGNWVDWEFRIKWGWDLSQDPYIEIYKNGEQIFDLQNHPNTTNDQRGVKWKLGLYKWDWSQPGSRNRSILEHRVVYYSDVSRTYLGQ